jgi:hypothetical protein
MAVLEEEFLLSNEDDPEKQQLLDLDPSLSDAEPSSSEGILNFF